MHGMGVGKKDKKKTFVLVLHARRMSKRKTKNVSVQAINVVDM